MKKIVSLIFFCSFFFYSNSQEINGLWEVTLVKVGEKEMTPNGKWTEFHSDGIFRSGNGWLQNARGSYSFENMLLGMTDSLGTHDEFGKFKVEFKGKEMK